MTKVNPDPEHASTTQTLEFNVYTPESYLKEEVFGKKSIWVISSIK